MVMTTTRTYILSSLFMYDLYKDAASGSENVNVSEQ
jgi:hypothetical protein